MTETGSIICTTDVEQKIIQYLNNEYLTITIEVNPTNTTTCILIDGKSEDVKNAIEKMNDVMRDIRRDNPLFEYSRYHQWLKINEIRRFKYTIPPDRFFDRPLRQENPLKLISDQLDMIMMQQPSPQAIQLETLAQPKDFAAFKTG